MIYQHQEMADGRWQKFSLVEQMANIGAEVGRAINWAKKDHAYSLLAAERALELLDLTLDDHKNKGRFKEIARVREAVVDFFWYQNEYSSSGQLWNSYFYPFNWAARANR
ncbi:MAG: hypothetical protein NTZ18_03555 [Candidatus Komeilibacteria bacterium]|nr:hypothetical protein [Candidatus Komeilibacteria bacterium]